MSAKQGSKYMRARKLISGTYQVLMTPYATMLENVPGIVAAYEEIWREGK